MWCIDALKEHAQQAKIETSKPLAELGGKDDIFMYFDMPSALLESLSHVLWYKCSCLIPSEDVLVCLYESNLRISA